MQRRSPIYSDGDILAFSGGDLFSRSISLATAWPFGPREVWYPPSHVGLVSCGSEGDYLVESTQLSSRPCLLQGTRTAGWQVHRPHERISDYLTGGGSVAVYRLVDHEQIRPEERDRFRALVFDWWRCAPYDNLGAALSGTRIWQLAGKLFPRANLDSLFCSEFVAAVLMSLGRLNRDQPARYNPGRLLRTLLWTGVYRLAFRIDPLQSDSFYSFAPWRFA